MKYIEKLVTTISIPLMFMNWFSFIVGGIWLLFFGEWWLVVQGIVFIFSASFILPFAMLISLLFFAIGSFFHSKFKPAYYLTVFINSLYTQILMAAFCFFVFNYCTAHIGIDADDRFSNILTVIPYFLISWSMALGPWQRMYADEPPDNYGSLITLFSGSTSYLLFLIAWFTPPIISALLFLLLLAIHFLIAPILLTYIAVKLEEESIE